MQDIKLGLGGGCHWCTEGVFSVVNGVKKIDQGWIGSDAPHDTLSEAIVVRFDPMKISLKDMIDIHLHTHSSTSDHSMRTKYRSAIYYFDPDTKNETQQILEQLQLDFKQSLITKILPFKHFKPSPEKYQQYLMNHSERPFCQTYIIPKIRSLMNRNQHQIDQEKMMKLEIK